MYQGFSHFSRFLHNFVLAKLVTSSIRVKACHELLKLLKKSLVLFFIIHIYVTNYKFTWPENCLWYLLITIIRNYKKVNLTFYLRTILT